MAGEIKKRLVELHFDKSANTYDQRTPLQESMACDLLNSTADRLNGRNVKSILELGCGTGRLTRDLRHRYPKSTILAIDLSSRMIDQAKSKLLNDDKVEFRIGDAETMAEMTADRGPFDLIISNAVVQWFDKPVESTRRYLGQLLETGIVSLSTFGPGTFAELRDSFYRAEQLLEIPHYPHVHSFPSREDWQKLSNAHDRPKVSIIETDQAVWFETVTNFLDTIRKTGSAYADDQGRPMMGKRLFREMIREYTRNHTDPVSGKIKATYHIVTVVAAAE